MERMRCVRWNSAMAGHITPDIKTLAHIVQVDLKHVKFYAGFIHILSFDDEGEDTNFTEEARWHKELAALEFRNLEEVAMYGFTAAMPMNSGDVVLHYVMPSVREFIIDEGTLLSDSFLETLNHRCPKLKKFGLGDVSENIMSEDGIVRFIEKSVFLTELNIRRALVESWTLKEFTAIARHLSLEILETPDIPDYWLDSLHDTRAISHSFPKVKRLVTGTSDMCLELLAQYIPHLESLALSLEALPSGIDINDSIIDEAAKYMGEMCVLILAFDRPDLLTWKSVLSFARHAHNLV